MRARIFLLGGTVGLIASAFLVEACGETEPVATVAPADSGAEVADSAPAKDAAVKEEDAAPPCDTSGDFTKDIPDASIADGASTSGICLGCAKSSCGKQVTACNEHCPCQELLGDAIGCYLANTANPTVCAGNFLSVDSTTQSIGFALIDCIQKSCKDECATAAIVGDAGLDGGDGG